VIFRRHREEHLKIERQLERQEQKLRDHDRRLRLIEIERGIYKPSVLKEVARP
jgi:hypothetical protein